MEYIFYFVVVALVALAVAMQPRAPKQKRPSLEDFSIPRANQGDAIPMVFGTVTITGPTVVWYGDLLVETETEDGVKTRKFYMGLHFILCHGPVDHFLAVSAGERLAWEGDVTASGTELIDNGSLFGGKRQAGGIYGEIDIMMGEPTQSANAYLTATQGTPQPAYRGVLSVVANQVYCAANTTSIEPWAFKISRFVNGWYGDDCWYPETCIVGSSYAETATVYAPLDEVPIQDGDTGTVLEKITQTYGALGNLVRAGSFTYITDGARVQSALTLNGRNCMIFEQESAGPCLSADYAASQTPPDVTDPNYLALFFPDNVGFIDVTFMCTSVNQNYPPPDTDPDFAMDYILSCGKNLNSALEANWSWALRIYPTDTINTGTLQFKWQDSSNVEHTASLIGAVSGAITYRARVDFTADSVTLTLYDLTFGGSVSITHAGAANIRQITDSGDPGYLFAGRLLRYPYHAFEGRMNRIIISTEELTGDTMNPAHIIYQAITDPMGMGLPAAMIDDESFRYAAETFFDEGLGLCMQWLQQEPVEDFIQAVCDHAACILRVSPRTGQFQLKPLRADYDPAALTVYDETEIIELEQWERVGYGELVGEVTITYRDMTTNKDAAVTAQNLAVIQAQSGVVAESISLQGIPTAAIARRVCMRELKARSVPLARCKIKTTRALWEALPGDVFALSWAKLGLTEVIMRVTSIEGGTLQDGTITVEAVEDVFGMPDSTYAAAQASGWTDPPIVDPEATTEYVRQEEDGSTRRMQGNTIRITG